MSRKKMRHQNKLTDPLDLDRRDQEIEENQENYLSDD